MYTINAIFKKIISLKFLVFLVYIILPYGIIILADNEWIGRVIGLTIVFFVTIPLLLYLGLNKKIKIIKAKGKINKVDQLKGKKDVIELGIRFMIVSFAIGFLFLFIIPFARDIYFLANEGTPLVTEQKIISNNSTFGAWFLSQTIQLEMNKKTNCYFLYSLKKRIRKNKSYEFKILPHSRLIVEVNEMEKTNELKTNRVRID